MGIVLQEVQQTVGVGESDEEPVTKQPRLSKEDHSEDTAAPALPDVIPVILVIFYFSSLILPSTGSQNKFITERMNFVPFSNYCTSLYYA